MEPHVGCDQSQMSQGRKVSKLKTADSPSGKEETEQGFCLTKYYLDAVADNGDYFVGYSANLRFKHLSIGYADALHSSELHGFKPGPSFGHGPEPVWDSKGLTWHHPKLGIEGSWLPLVPPWKTKLLSTAEGHVTWNCIQPGSKVLLKTGAGQIVEALGYCELLTLTIPPWRLGLKELTWGRFVSATQSVVWIDWRGENEIRLVLWNGTPTDLADISENKVTTNDFTISVAPVKTLRQGFFGPNILAKIPKILHLAPTVLLQVHETKQLGHGVLEMPDGHREKGWVIYETIVWPD